ncbi:hypothetical protein [Paraburkholderia sediminicola]|uniref:hypothetical protein n=1 Tax=Paraburkholderia sediminicola TaxID=458836 RepID=UPI0038BC949F
MKDVSTSATPAYDAATDGKRQLAAGIALLGESGLLKWNQTDLNFEALDEGSFEKKAEGLHPRFGRVMLWGVFSTGSEYLLKGALILSGEFSPTPVSKASLEDIPWTASWFQKVISNKFETADALDYATLGGGKLDEKIKQLCDSHADGAMVRAAFKVLANAIRNRDAHAYVKGVRADHFYLSARFAEAYTALLGWLKPDVVKAAVEIASRSTTLSEECNLGLPGGW